MTQEEINIHADVELYLLGKEAGKKEVLESEEYKKMQKNAERWKILVEKVHRISNETNDPMSFHLSVGEVVTELIGK